MAWTAAPVQSKAGAPSGSDTTIVATFDAAVGSGNSVVGVCCFADSGTVSSVTDDQSNAYTIINDTLDTTDGERQATFASTAAITNAPTTITVTLSASCGFRVIAIEEYTGGVGGVRTSAAQFQDSAGTGTDAITSGTTGGAANSGDLVWGACAGTGGGATVSAGTGFTQRTAASSNPSLTTETKLSSGGTEAATFTQASGAQRVTSVIVLKETNAQVLTPSLFTNTNTFQSPRVDLPFGARKGTLQATATSIPASFAATGSVAVCLGDLIVAVVGQQTALTVSAMTDNLGNSYTAQNAGTDAGNITGRLYYSIVTVAGTVTSVTATCTSSANDAVIGAAVIQGPFSAIDKNIANITSDITSPFTAPTSGTLNTSKQAVIAWGACNSTSAWSATSPNLLALDVNVSANAKITIGYQAVTETTAVAPAFTAGANPAQAVLSTLTFKHLGLVEPTIVVNEQTFFTPDVSSGAGTQNLTPSLYSDSDTFFSATITTGAVTLTPSLYADADTFPSATVSHGLTADLYGDADTFFAATVTVGAVTLSPALYTDADTFHNATVTAGAVTLTPDLYSDADTFFAATITNGVTLTPSLYADADTFFAATVSPGAVTIAPALFSDADTFFAATVTTGAVTIAPDLYADADTFFNHVVTRAGTTLDQTARFDDADAFHSPAVSTGAVALQPGLYTDADAFFSPTLSHGLAAGLFSEADSFHAATVTATRDLAPALYSDADAFHAPSITVVLAPDLAIDADTFFAATVSPGGVNLAASLYVDADVFHAANIIEGGVTFSPAALLI